MNSIYRLLCGQILIFCILDTHCETDIDECASDPCQNDATCNDAVNMYTCTCDSGWTGTRLL